MLDWLREKRQSPVAIERYWRQVLVSAINEELDRMAAAHGFQVFWLGLLASADSYEMGVAAVPLRDLYGEESLARSGSVRMHHRAPVTAIEMADGFAGGGDPGCGRPQWKPIIYVSCLPFERLQPLMPELPIDWNAFEHSPITGIHLWFDRPVTDLPHATLLDRTIQWMFNKNEGRYLQLVVSASRSLTEMPRSEVIELAVRELAEFFPEVRRRVLEKAHVIKEVRATFSAVPGLEAKRPVARTRAAKFVSGGGLDAVGLAGHDGGRGAQRIHRGGSCGTGGRAAAAFSDSRCRIMDL